MYREGPTFVGNVVLQGGVLDNQAVLDGLRMEVELFAPLRVAWVPKLEGTVDCAGMD